jgi:hypothetical protein
MDVIWDGVTRTEDLKEEWARTRHAPADAAKRYDWPRVLEMITEHRELANTTRLGGSSLYTVLHQAAHGGAKSEIVDQLLRLGAWRTVLNARGERAVDVAERCGHRHLLDILAPVYKHSVPLGVLLKVQARFHCVIRGRAEELVTRQQLRLPELEPLLELDDPKMWFAVPGMYGGFSFCLVEFGVGAKRVSESWCRVVGGSGQRHEITSAGSELVEEGFV